jgi:hypothetical protein
MRVRHNHRGRRGARALQEPVLPSPVPKPAV